MNVSPMPQRSNEDFIQSASITSMMRALLNTKDGVLNNPDYLAKYFVAEPWSSFLKNPESSISTLEDRLPGGIYYILIRTKYFDNSLLNWIKLNPKSQIVSLGSGFDSRSIRFNNSNDLTFFEVDLKAMLDHKKTIISNNNLSKHLNIKYINTNFQTDNLFDNLRKGGFNETLPTFFLCEGVSFFLDEKIFNRLLTDIRALDSERITFSYDYAFRNYIEGDLNYYGAKQAYNELIKLGEPHVFGLNYLEIDSYFQERGFTPKNNYMASMLDILYLGNKYGENPVANSTAFFGLVEVELQKKIGNYNG